jgi:hypothetical protein
MPKEIEFDGVVHEFPDDFTDEDIAAALGGSTPAAPTQSLTQRVAGMLPTAGGMVGSLAGTLGGGALTGGWGAVAGRTAGAAAGGAAGQGYGQLLKHATEIPGALMDVGRNLLNPETRSATMRGGMEGMTQGIKDAGLSGAIQGGAEAAGGTVGKGAAAFAPRLMQSVLKPTQAIRDSFPQVAKDTVKAGVAIGQSGAQKVGRLMDRTSGKVMDKLRLAERMGAKPVNPADVASRIDDSWVELADRPLRASRRSELDAAKQAFLAENPNPIPLSRAQALKRGAQKDSSAAYKKLDRGGDINESQAQANVDLARGFREEIEKRANVGPLNAELQKLIGVDRAHSNAMGRIMNNNPIGMNAAIASSVGTGAGLASGDVETGGALGLGVLALTNPHLASRLAIGLDRAAPAIAQTPNAGRAALMALLAQEE